MDKKISLTNKIIVGIIAVIGLIFYIMIMKDTEDAGGYIDGMLKFTYIVLAFAALASVWVWFKEMLSHPEKLKQTALVTVLFLVIVAIAKYGLASNQPAHYKPNINIDATTSNWVDTGLYTFYILGTIAILLMFLSPVLSGIGMGGNKASEELEEEYEEESNDEA